MYKIRRWIDSNNACLFWALGALLLGLGIVWFVTMALLLFQARRAGAEPLSARATITPITPAPTATVGPTATPAPYPEPYPAPAEVARWGLFAIGEKQAQLSGRWVDDTHLTLTWQGAPAGSCVYRVDRYGFRAFLPYDCASAGIAQLGPGDQAYAPRPGDTYILRDELGGRDLVAIRPARVLVPIVIKPLGSASPAPSPTPIRMIMPIVLAP